VKKRQYISCPTYNNDFTVAEIWEVNMEFDENPSTGIDAKVSLSYKKANTLLEWNVTLVKLIPHCINMVLSFKRTKHSKNICVRQGSKYHNTQNYKEKEKRHSIKNVI